MEPNCVDEEDEIRKSYDLNIKFSCHVIFHVSSLKMKSTETFKPSLPAGSEK